MALAAPETIKQAPPVGKVRRPAVNSQSDHSGKQGALLGYDLKE
jgi:hypothetical protein